MKQVIIIAIAAISFFSCKKDKNSNNSSGNATVTAENYGFDGGSTGKFSSTKAGIIQTSAGGINTLAISAIKDGGSESITIMVLKNVTTTGVIKFSSSLSNGGIILMKDYTKPGDLTQRYSTDNDGTSTKGGGEINITKLDGNTIEGSFYAVMFNSTGKTAFAEQGSFKGTITKQ